MKIAITASGNTLDGQVDPRFGRCSNFIIVDPETLEFEAISNSGGQAAGGAGIATAQMIADKGVTAVLTGNCGPNAYNVLKAAGIDVHTNVNGSIKDAIEEFKLGSYPAADQANVASHNGQKAN